MHKSPSRMGEKVVWPGDCLHCLCETPCSASIGVSKPALCAVEPLKIRGVIYSSLTHCFLVVGQEPLASAKWSLLSLPVPSTLNMGLNSKIGILQKGEPCDSVGLFLLFLVCQMAGILDCVCWCLLSFPLGFHWHCLLLSLSPAHSELPLVPHRPLLLTNEKAQT